MNAEKEEEISQQETDAVMEEVVGEKRMLQKIKRIQVQNKRLKRRLGSIESTLRKYNLD